jgi:hypothetical protein
MKRCTELAEALVEGEPLDENQRAHLARCSDCAALAALPRLVATAAVVPEPGPGFSARVAANARERVASRRRQRVAGFGLAAVAAAGLAVVVVRHDGASAPHQESSVATLPRPGGSDGIAADPDTAPSGDEISDDELRGLVAGDSLSDVMTPSTSWDEIEQPLNSYRAVLRLGGQP